MPVYTDVVLAAAWRSMALPAGRLGVDVGDGHPQAGAAVAQRLGPLQLIQIARFRVVDRGPAAGRAGRGRRRVTVAGASGPGRLGQRRRRELGLEAGLSHQVAGAAAQVRWRHRSRRITIGGGGCRRLRTVRRGSPASGRRTPDEIAGCRRWHPACKSGGGMRQRCPGPGRLAVVAGGARPRPGVRPPARSAPPLARGTSLRPLFGVDVGSPLGELEQVVRSAQVACHQPATERDRLPRRHPPAARCRW